MDAQSCPTPEAELHKWLQWTRNVPRHQRQSCTSGYDGRAIFYQMQSCRNLSLAIEQEKL